MHKFILFFSLISMSLCLLLTSCKAGATDPASRAVEDYLNALVTRDSARFATLYCASWESQATLEFDSLQAVKARLDGVACKTSGNSSGSITVKCQGKIIATYNNEDQAFDLSTRSYQVVQQNGDFLVCGHN